MGRWRWDAVLSIREKKMTDFFFQIILSLVGILIGILGQVMPNVFLKRLAALVGGLVVIVGILWIAYEASGFGFLPNPYAEVDGIIWNTAFYGNKELKEPITLQTKIRGARNGLRINWSIKPPDFGCHQIFLSNVYNNI
jgi:hypothetical protein